MLQATGEPPSSQPGPNDPPAQARSRGKSFTVTVRFPYAGEPLRLIIRAARLRGVAPRAYIRERAIACALAELRGEKRVDLNSLER